MHIISDASLKRPGWVYRRAQSGSFVGSYVFVEPRVNWKHVDGPLLYVSDGSLHWLTYWERIQLFFGWTDVHEIDFKCRR
ncbi:hypothetical protein AYJ54_00520 [Bradyrhizobium centrolobii]|uniref:Uncharacterized protein n=1 Tax=Bradyrhizobium centrolobii TaxID=1505087 RepID=A0A176YFK9_9BRAD|nr:hypothetical protein [Bradyrhizobium centrolobii]OAF05423.1 hypothetical protein AYJ54_00520 [Bradyrhizobium centrolobii]